MSSTYTGAPANGARSPAVAITVPADGDIGNAASVNTALDRLTDFVAWLQGHAAIFDESNTFSAAQTIAALLTLSTSNVSLTAAALQSILKSGGKLQAGTSDANDLELLRAGAVMLALTSGGIDAKNSALVNLARAQLQNLTSDPTTPPEGTVWYRSDLDRLRAMIGAAVANLATEDYVASLSMKAGGRLTCLAGGAVTVSEGVNVASASWSTNVLSIDYSSALPSVTRPYIFNDYPATGARLCRCTANLTTAITIRRLDLSGADSAWAAGDVARLAVF